MHRSSIIIFLLVLLTGIPAVAELCKPCQSQSYTKDIGVCKECGGMTTSGAFKLCMACSDRLHQCEHCRTALPATKPATSAIDTSKDGTYTASPWEYRYTISNAGSRSEGYYGRLSFGGEAVPEPADLNDYYETPWGKLYWVGQPFVAFGVHGWMPKPLVRAKVGKPLPAPAAPPAKPAA